MEMDVNTHDKTGISPWAVSHLLSLDMKMSKEYGFKLWNQSSAHWFLAWTIKACAIACKVISHLISHFQCFKWLCTKSKVIICIRSWFFYHNGKRGAGPISSHPQTVPLPGGWTQWVSTIFSLVIVCMFGRCTMWHQIKVPVQYYNVGTDPVSDGLLHKKTIAPSLLMTKIIPSELYRAWVFHVLNWCPRSLRLVGLAGQRHAICQPPSLSSVWHTHMQ